MRLHTHTHTHKENTQTHKHTRTQTHTRGHTDTRTHGHTDTRTRRHTDTQTHSHRRTNAHTLARWGQVQRITHGVGGYSLLFVGHYLAEWTGYAVFSYLAFLAAFAAVPVIDETVGKGFYKFRRSLLLLCLGSIPSPWTGHDSLWLREGCMFT